MSEERKPDRESPKEGGSYVRKSGKLELAARTAAAGPRGAAGGAEKADTAASSAPPRDKPRGN